MRRTSEVRLEHLVGRMVHDPAGRRVGRIEEVLAEREDARCRVLEYEVGEFGLVERLAAGPLMRSLLRHFRWAGYRGYRILWDQMDLADPDRPCATVPKDELRHIEE